MADTDRPSNRLSKETSPYLLQHAHNPVDWYPWGPEALDRAKQEDRPILLSIGYAACHWCHVMERESFEDEDVAALMNRHFVCVKVDREERPDIDDIYMAATVATSGGGGWPMTVFLTPEQEPFFAGTYFPPEDKYGRPGFRSLLRRIADLWQTDRDDLVRQAAALTQQVRVRSEPDPPAVVAGDAIDEAVKVLGMQFDQDWGGFGGAPKFPPHGALELLLRHHHRTGSEHALKMATRTLDAMRAGGMYDHVGGGFARYSTDAEWLVPHFEKMLYDNAQLARVYLWAFQVTGDDDYRIVATETLDYVVREMQDDAGGYFSATDADSEGVEGKFFVWTVEEISDVLGRDDADAFCAYYDITAGGNWEGLSIPRTKQSLDEVAGELGQSPTELAELLTSCRARVYEARSKRVPPLLDDKILTAWNGLMIGAMAEGYRVLGVDAYLDSARRAAAYVGSALRRDDGGLFRTARDGKAHLDAYLEDYAYLTDALVDLYEAGGDAAHLDEAARLADRLIDDFADPEGGALFHTAKEHEALIIRTREGHDGAVPNPNSVAARALVRLSYLLGREGLRQQAVGALRAYGRAIERQPRAFPTALGVVDLLLEGPVELVFAGESAETVELRRRTGKRYLPNRVVAHALPTTATKTPLLQGKDRVGGSPALYVCRDFTCEAPVTGLDEVDRVLASAIDANARARKNEIRASLCAGSATEEGTRRFEKRHAPVAFRDLGETRLRVAPIGFGGYRVADTDPEHRAALELALDTGCNLVDTSTNYTDGRSERLIGEVLAGRIHSAALRRDEIVVVSKIGYVQGKNLEVAQDRDRTGRPFPEMVDYDEGLRHCIHPEWLEDQLSRSLERLGLETLDVCLLHNPEYFLSDAKKRSRGPLEEVRAEFYRRLADAFAHFEKEIERGRLRAYGVSSNTCTSPVDSPESTDLSRMLAAARDAAGADHHFRVLQLPMNLREVGAVFEQNTNGAPVLEHARKNQVAVLVNRPLNAIGDAGLVRLADPPLDDRAPPFEQQLSRVERLEAEYRREIASSLRAAPGSRVSPESLFNWSDQLSNITGRIHSLEQWSEIEAHAVLPRLFGALTTIERAMVGGAAQTWLDWKERYLPEVEGLLGAIRQHGARQSARRAGEISSAIDSALPEPKRAESLSRKALWTLASTPGVTTVLVGMREPRYVKDALGISGWEPLASVEPVYEGARTLGWGAPD